MPPTGRRASTATALGATAGVVGGCGAEGLIYWDLIDFLFEELFNASKARLFLLADEGDRQPLIVATTGSTTDAVYIVLGVVGDVIVDHHADVVDIDTARHDVGGDEQIDIA